MLVNTTQIRSPTMKLAADELSTAADLRSGESARGQYRIRIRECIIIS